MKIVKAEMAECRVPLPCEIRLGHVKVTTRDYAVVRLKRSDGAIGEALGYVRNTALLASLEIVANYLVGSEFNSASDSIDAFLRAHVNGRITFHRAISLIDIALSDMHARTEERPLHAILGTRRTRLPTMAVAGYYLAERTVDDVAAEVKSYFDDGVSIVKVMINGHDKAADLALVEKLSAICPGRLAIDAHWSWDSVEAAATYLKAFDAIGLRFIEDPFGAHNARLTPALQVRLRTGLAIGEDIPEVNVLRRLAGDLPFLRVDATTCGGVEAALSVLNGVDAARTQVLPHVFPHLHAHFGASFDSVAAVEFITPEVGADPLDRLLKHPLEIVYGQLRVSDEPGAGMALDWQAVEALQHKSATVSAA